MNSEEVRDQADQLRFKREIHSHCDALYAAHDFFHILAQRYSKHMSAGNRSPGLAYDLMFCYQFLVASVLIPA